VAYRRLICGGREALQEKLMTFVKGAVGGSYKLGAMKMLKLKSHSKDKEMNNN